MKLTFKSTLLFGIGFAILLGLQFYFIRNSYRLEEKELLRQAREIAMEVMDQINDERQLNEDEKSEQHWLLKIDLINYQTDNVYPFDQQKELSYRIDSILNAKTVKSNFKIELIHEIYSVLDLEKNIEKLPKGTTLVFYKSSGDISNGNTIVEGKWTSKHSNNNTETSESVKSSHYFRSRSIFELKNINQLLLIQILPLSLVSSFILILLLILFYKNQKTIQLKQKQIKRLHTTIDSIAHELNTPLATMKFQLATAESSESKVLFQRQIGKLEKIVRSIHFDINKGPLASKEQMEQYVNDLQQTHPNIIFNTQINWKYNHLIGIFELQIILSNLIDNAVKYGGINLWITLHFGKKITIEVSDDGIGVPRNEQEMIFEKYYRVAHHTPSQSHGLGIGLYIVNQVVEQLQGTIKVKQNHPTGTTFTIILPNEN